MSVAKGAVTHLNLIKCMKIQIGECSFSSKHLPNQVGNCFFRWEFAAIGKKLRKHFDNFFSNFKLPTENGYKNLKKKVEHKPRQCARVS